MLTELAGQAGSQISAQANTGLDLSLVIAIAALVLSALSPLISALVSGVFNIKEKRLDISAKKNEQEQEFYYRHRAEVIENYIRATGEEIESLTRTSHANFGSVMGEIYLYVDSSLWPLLDKISQFRPKMISSPCAKLFHPQRSAPKMNPNQRILMNTSQRMYSHRPFGLMHL